MAAKSRKGVLRIKYCERALPTTRSGNASTYAFDQRLSEKSQVEPKRTRRNRSHLLMVTIQIGIPFLVERMSEACLYGNSYELSRCGMRYVESVLK
ncbi:hypothetical protein SASPL_155516 (mitochondrion) [Salvia splendens]|uniref:Uncharacterized protein n=1 Tax=Salvia splendens TaxID=180675 RepID=A0A8X8YY28_SALSN|nr:hypothetical protein SASPL_156323 [Salvia splendens]KAG6383927.1 hypothetical protein SASPL_156356 [Salvia splendens]KAG6384664.1 hypothetical protein SASPL_155516 [Salvia splendens]